MKTEVNIYIEQYCKHGINSIIPSEILFTYYTNFIFLNNYNYGIGDNFIFGFKINGKIANPKKHKKNIKLS